MNEIGLTAQKCRGLQHIHNGRDRFDLVYAVHVGQHRHAKLRFDFTQYFQSGIHPEAAKRLSRTAIGLVIRGLVNERQIQFTANFLQSAGCIHRHLLRLDYAGPCNQKQRAVQTSFKVT